MNELISTHLTEIINLLVLLISGGFWMDARQKRAEVKSSEADATKKIVDLYQETIDDLERRYKDRYAELEKWYKERLDNMKVEIRREVENELNDLRDEVKSLRTNLELWKTKYRKLKEAFDDYRQKHGDK